MTEQLLGVLRQVVATDGGSPAAAPSVHFSAELGADPDAYPWQFLPVPAVDPADPAAGVLATVALLGPDQRHSALASMACTPELSLGMVRLALDDGDLDAARAELATAEAREGGWRAAWWRGVLFLAEGHPSEALPYFGAVAGELPGELDPRRPWPRATRTRRRIATPEATRDGASRSLGEAARYYAMVADTDATFVGADFGLARVFLALGDRDGAVGALERVPKASSAYVAAQSALCTARAARRCPGPHPTSRTWWRRPRCSTRSPWRAPSA